MRAPRSIGPYRVVRELGRGGMGAVFEVRHPRVPRPLALKQMHLGRASAEAMARFRREAQLLARIRHPGVVAVHQLGEAPQGLFLVTEMVEGRSLAEWVREGPHEPRTVALLLRQLADALAAVHAVGILHRDLKPENVIVRPDGAPVLLDFGLARELDAEGLTRTGSLLGTPAYMSPEQAGGESPARLDARTDVYGLGAILFALLAGRAPFVGVGMFELLKQVMLDEPVWPSSERAETPAALEAICRRAMAKARMDRYPDVAALSAELERFLADEAVEAAASPPSRRVSLLLTFSVGGALALGALGLWLARRGEPAAAPATPAPRATAPPRATPQADPQEALSALLARRDLPPGPARAQLYRELRAWTAAQPGHPGHGRAERVLARMRESPLLSLPRPAQLNTSEYVRTWARAVGNTGALLCHNTSGRVQLWELGGEEARVRQAWSTPARFPERVIRATACAGEALLLGGDALALLRVQPRGGDEVQALWHIPADATPFSPARDIYALAVSSDGQLAAVGGDWEEVWVVSLEDGKTRQVLAGQPAPIQDLVFAAGGTRLLVAYGRVGQGGTGRRELNGVRTWDLASGELVGEPLGLTGRANDLTVSPDGEQVAVGTQGWQVFLLDPRAGTVRAAASAPDFLDSPVGAIRAHGGLVAGVAFAEHDPSLLYSVSSNLERTGHELRLWRVAPAGDALTQVRCLFPQVGLQSVALSPDGAWVLLGTYEGLEVWGGE